MLQVMLQDGDHLLLYVMWVIVKYISSQLSKSQNYIYDT